MKKLTKAIRKIAAKAGLIEKPALVQYKPDPLRTVFDFLNDYRVTALRLEGIKQLRERASNGGILSLNQETVQDGLFVSVPAEFLFPHIQLEVAQLEHRLAEGRQKIAQLVAIIQGAQA